MIYVLHEKSAMSLRNSLFPSKETGESGQGSDQQPPKYELSQVRSADGGAVAISATDDSLASNSHQAELASGQPVTGPPGSNSKSTHPTVPVDSGSTSNPNDMAPNLYRNRIGFW